MFDALFIARHVYETRLVGAQQPISLLSGQVQSRAGATAASRGAAEASYLNDPFTGDYTRYLNVATGNCIQKESDH